MLFSEIKLGFSNFERCWVGVWGVRLGNLGNCGGGIDRGVDNWIKIVKGVLCGISKILWGNFW